VRFELDLSEDREEQEEIRILLVEDHASLRQAVADLFDREPEFTIVDRRDRWAKHAQCSRGSMWPSSI
jgi:hypothetical protein